MLNKSDPFRYANFYTDEPMCECLKISEGGNAADRDAVFDEWATGALRRNMSIVACDPDNGQLLGECDVLYSAIQIYLSKVE